MGGYVTGDLAAVHIENSVLSISDRTYSVPITISNEQSNMTWRRYDPKATVPVRYSLCPYQHRQLRLSGSVESVIMVKFSLEEYSEGRTLANIRSIESR
jgi:hypothetical protein